MTAPSLDELLAPGFVQGLRAIPLDDLRHRRAQAAEVEVGLSYARRVVQGRLDIVRAEFLRRELGQSSGDLPGLVERLPEILGDRVHAPGNGRLPTLMAPNDADAHDVMGVDDLVDPSRLADLSTLDADGLAGLDGELSNLEHEVSRNRKAVHEVIDRLQEELVRRYKSGEASVDKLLE